MTDTDKEQWMHTNGTIKYYDDMQGDSWVEWESHSGYIARTLIPRSLAELYGYVKDDVWLMCEGVDG